MYRVHVHVQWHLMTPSLGVLVKKKMWAYPASAPPIGALKTRVSSISLAGLPSLLVVDMVLGWCEGVVACAKGERAK